MNKKFFNKQNLTQERGITLIALIITIIILVILAAVSVRAVYNMGIVDYAVNGTQNYAKAGVAENKMLDETGSLIEKTLLKIKGIEEGTGISLNKTEITLQLREGQTVTEELMVTLLNIKGDITWASSKEEVATVSNNGTVTAVSTGTAVVTATVEFDEAEYTAECRVKVKEPATFAFSVTEGEGTEAVTTNYTWDDVNEMAKTISGMSNINRTSNEVTITNYNGKNVRLYTGIKMDLIGVIGSGNTKSNYTYTVRIIGFNTDVLSSDQYEFGENYTQGTTKAGITFEFTNFFRWDGTKEQTRMNPTASSADGWGASEMQSNLNAPDTLARLTNNKYIKTVDKKYIKTYTFSTSTTEINVSADKLWLLACSEIWPEESGTGRTRYGFGATSAESDGQYKWYADNIANASSFGADADLIKNTTNYSAYPSNYGGDTASSWWLRSFDCLTSTDFCVVLDSGLANEKHANGSTWKVSPGFCV